MENRSEGASPAGTIESIDTVRSRWAADPRRMVVTGAGGFIGSHIAEQLTGLGQAVVGVDNFATGRRENVAGLEERATGSPGEFTLQVADVRKFDDCMAFCEGTDVVFHQAALGSVPRSIANPRASFQSNVDGLFNVLEAARLQGVSTVVFASSSSVYGDARTLPMREDTIGLPLSPYAATKRINEVTMQAYCTSFDIAVVGLRYFNVFGPRQDPAGPYSAVIPRWTDALLNGKRPQIYGDGETSRDFCPVANVVQANILAAERAPQETGAVFNVGLGRQTSLRELFRALQRGLSARGVKGLPEEPEYIDFRPGDLPHSRADISSARCRLGYSPAVDFATGLESTLDWALARPKA